MLRQLRDGIAIVAMMAGGGALLFVAWQLIDGPWRASEIAKLRALPSWEQSQTGELTMVSGVIAGSTPTLREGLVLYKREQSRNGYRASKKLVTIGLGKQRLTIETPDGPVRIINDDFAFDERREPWAPVERIETPASLSANAILISGFEPGHPVIATGRRDISKGDAVLVATMIGHGPRGAYFSAVSESQSRLRRALPFMLLAGLLSLWLGVRIWRG